MRMVQKLSEIETYLHDGDGYRPLLIRVGWQVAQLNDRADLHADSVCQIECHDATDEAFVLVKGDATLVAATEATNGLAFETLRMRSGVTYNMPAGVWHTIVTSPGMQVLIVERDNTHLSDVRHRMLADAERLSLQDKLAEGRNGHE